MLTINIIKEKELKQLYNLLAHQNNKETITAFFDFTREDLTKKMKGFSNEWKEKQSNI